MRTDPPSPPHAQFFQLCAKQQFPLQEFLQRQRQNTEFVAAFQKDPYERMN